MAIIELSDDEVRLVRAALHAFLDDFGHNETDVLRRIKTVMAKLPASLDEAGEGAPVS
jgi:hypothetical protein